jgi:hypothetical protein
MDMHACERVDLAYFDTAPVRIASEVTIAASAADVECASVPDRSTTPLPDFRHTAAMSTVTFGRDS